MTLPTNPLPPSPNPAPPSSPSPPSPSPVQSTQADHPLWTGSPVPQLKDVSHSLADGNSFFDIIMANPVFAGGAGLASVGAAASFLRRGLIWGVASARRGLLVHVEISRQDPSYPWLLAWLAMPRPAHQGFLASRITRVHQLSVTTTLAPGNAPASKKNQAFAPPSLSSSSSSSAVPGATTVGEASVFLQPGYGQYVMKHKNAYFLVQREKHGTANMNTGEPHETLKLTTLYALRHVFQDVFAEAHQLAAQAHQGKTIVYAARNIDWVPLGEPRTKRPLGSVVLDAGVQESVVADVQDFLQRQSWYVERGIPYRRGYLLYGPPGSGKSSFIQALAGALDYSVAMINLSEMGMTDDKLAYLLTKLPSRSLLLLEDADAAFVNRRQRDADGYSGATVTFSGLLNALDGVAAGEERIAFLTTNHLDRLDPALIRPGRVDMMVHVGAATRHQAAAMWDRFYADQDTPDGQFRQRFLQRLDDLGCFAPDTATPPPPAAKHGPSADTDTDTDTNADKPVADQAPPPPGRWQTTPAALQGLFLFHKNDMEGAIANAHALQPRAL